MFGILLFITLLPRCYKTVDFFVTIFNLCKVIVFFSNREERPQKRISSTNEDRWRRQRLLRDRVKPEAGNLVEPETGNLKQKIELFQGKKKIEVI